MLNKIKKLLSLLYATIFLIVILPVQAFAAVDEAIELSVTFLDSTTYEETKQNFTMLDLSEVATRDFADEVEGDQKGGWSDQGSRNDMRMFTYRGTKKFLNIPFSIVDPVKNDGKAVIVVRGQNDFGVPTRVDVPVNTTAAGAYFLHCAPYGGEIKSERYEFVYEDGTKAFLTLKSGTTINDFWSNSSGTYNRIVFTAANERTNTASLGVLALSNPHPEKVIKSIGIQTPGNAAYLAVVGITLTDSGPYLPDMADESLNPNRKYWVEYGGENRKIEKDSLLDFSYSLDAPAGNHGALKKNGSEFVFADGKKIKFWGTNIVGKACFPDEEHAEKMADQIAKTGFNLVRLSEIDKYIFGENEYGVIDSSMAEKMMGLITCLKNKGVYTYIAPVSDERFALLGFIDNDLIALQKKYISELLMCKNSEGTIELGKDNSIVMLEFLDSNSVFGYKGSAGIFGANDQRSNELLNERYNEFIENKYKTDAARNAQYGEGYGVNPDETIREKTLKINQGWRTEILNRQLGIDTREFMAKMQKNYYAQMKKVVDEYGSNIMTTCNSNIVTELIVADSYSNTNCDFVARNAIWSAPWTNNDKVLDTTQILSIRTSVIKDSEIGIFGQLTSSRFANTPYIISKYATGIHNPYQNETIFMMAAIGGQQGWNPIHYAYINGEIQDEPILTDLYSTRNNIGNMAVLSASSELYRSIDVPSIATETIGDNEIYADNTPNTVLLEDRLSKRYELLPSSDTVKVDKGVAENVIFNKNIYIDSNLGFFAADSDKCSGLTMNEPINIRLRKFGFNSKSKYATVILNGEKGTDIESANRLLLTAVGRTMNANMSIIPNVDKFADVGTSPVYIEPIEGQIDIYLSGAYCVYALDLSGNRISEIETRKIANGFSFTLSKYNKCIYYEIERR